MSSAGHVFAMLSTLRNNSRQLKKHFKGLPEHYEKYKFARAKSFNGKKISAEKLRAIKLQIQQESITDRRRNIALSIIIFLFVSLGTYLVVKTIGQETAEFINKKQQGAYENKSPDEKFIELMTNGKQKAARGNYKSAKIYYKEAYDINPNYQAHHSLTRAYVYDCIENNIDCEQAEYWLNKSISTFGDLYEFRRLKELFDK